MGAITEKIAKQSDTETLDFLRSVSRFAAVMVGILLSGASSIDAYAKNQDKQAITSQVPDITQLIKSTKPGSETHVQAEQTQVEATNRITEDRMDRDRDLAQVLLGLVVSGKLLLTSRQLSKELKSRQKS